MKTRTRRAGVAGACALIAAGFAVAFAGPAAATIVPVSGYVWANQPSVAAYTPAANYSYNSSGQPNRITRTGVGTYAVDFPGLAASSKGGTVDVSGYELGSTPGYCKTTGWGVDSSGSGTAVGVLCFGLNGRRHDQRFTAVFAVTPRASTTAYLWADQPSAGSYTPSPFYSYNGFSAPIQITRQSPGQYTVVIGQAANASPTVKVTAYGGDNINCVARQWQIVNATERIGVTCYTVNAGAADSRFDLTYAAGTSLLGQVTQSAYATGDHLVLTDYTPSEQFRYPDEGAITVHRSGPGQYGATIPGQAVATGHVEVTSTEAGLTCDVYRWVANGPDELVQVDCFDSVGDPLDSGWVLQWVVGA